MNKQWIKHVFFSLFEHGAVRVLDGIIIIYLIRILSSEYFGAFSVYQSWVSIILLFLPFLELILYRNYSDYKSTGELSRVFGILYKYNLIKLVIAFIFILVVSLVSNSLSWIDRFFILILAAALPLSQSFFSLFQSSLKFEMFQHKVAIISTLQRLVFLLVLFGISNVFQRNIPTLVSGGIVVYIIFSLVWFKSSNSICKIESVKYADAIPAIKGLLFGSVVWIHLNGVITGIVQTLDVFFLNYTHTSFEEISRYSVAFKTANFFQMLPIGIVSSLGVYLGKVKNESSPAKEKILVYKITFLFSILCLGLYFLGIAVAEPLLIFIGKGKISLENISITKEFFKWQLIGILFMASMYPISTYVGARLNLKKITFTIFVPWILFSSIVYYISALNGTVITAKANVLVYVFLNLLIFIKFYRKNK